MNIAIITPTLGLNKNYLELCAASVFEILAKSKGIHIVVTPKERVDEVQRWLPKSTVIPEERNGLYPAINTGLRYAIANCSVHAFTYINDDDGLVSSGFLHAIEEYAGCQGMAIVYGRVRYVDANGRGMGDASISGNPVDLLPLFAYGISGITQQGTIFPVRCFGESGGFDESFRLAADGEWIVRLLCAGNQFVFVDECVAYYRCREGQLSDDIVGMKLESARVKGIALKGIRQPSLRLMAWIRFRLKHVPTIVRRMRISGFQTTRNMFNRKGEVE